MSRQMIVCWAIAFSTLGARAAHSQGMTGTLIGTVKDQQGGAIVRADVRVSSGALIGGPSVQPTNEKGQLRFPALPPGAYTLEVRASGFAAYHEDGIALGAG